MVALLSIVLGLGSSASPLEVPLQTRPDGPIVIEATDGTVDARALVWIGEFQRDAHTYSLKKLSPDTGQRVFIDGRFAWGLEGTDQVEYPRDEIRSIVVTVGDKSIALPRDAFSDCYEPQPVIGEKSKDGESYRWRYYYLWVSSSKKLATLKMLCSDGTGSYRVIWTVHDDGTWSRETEPMG